MKFVSVVYFIVILCLLPVLFALSDVFKVQFKKKGAKSWTAVRFVSPQQKKTGGPTQTQGATKKFVDFTTEPFARLNSLEPNSKYLVRVRSVFRTIPGSTFGQTMSKWRTTQFATRKRKQSAVTAPKP